MSQENVEVVRLWTLRRGPVIRVEQFFDLERAEEAAVLRE